MGRFFLSKVSTDFKSLVSGEVLPLVGQHQLPLSEPNQTPLHCLLNKFRLQARKGTKGRYKDMEAGGEEGGHLQG